jgi:hypothetical protein
LLKYIDRTEWINSDTLADYLYENNLLRPGQIFEKNPLPMITLTADARRAVNLKNRRRVNPKVRWEGTVNRKVRWEDTLWADGISRPVTVLTRAGLWVNSGWRLLRPRALDS